MNFEGVVWTPVPPLDPHMNTNLPDLLASYDDDLVPAPPVLLEEELEVLVDDDELDDDELTLVEEEPPVEVSDDLSGGLILTTVRPEPPSEDTELPPTPDPRADVRELPSMVEL